MTATALSNDPPAFPPVFNPIALGSGDAADRALREAAAGSGAGTLVWVDAPERFDCAVVLEPDRPLSLARPAIHVAALAAADALSALGPPNKQVTFVWPQRVAIDGALVGHLRMVWPADATDDAVPDWLVVGVTIRMRWPASVQDPGLTPDMTALHEEGFGAVEVPDLAESFSRHLLLRINRWQEDGFASLAPDWLGRLWTGNGESGVRHGLDDNGDLLLFETGTTEPRRRSLKEALSMPDRH